MLSLLFRRHQPITENENHSGKPHAGSKTDGSFEWRQIAVPIEVESTGNAVVRDEHELVDVDFVHFWFVSHRCVKSWETSQKQLGELRVLLQCCQLFVQLGKAALVLAFQCLNGGQ